MEVSIRKFIEEDIPYKVKWINNAENNTYLHYDLPLKEDKTLVWFKTIKYRTDRADYTIICNGEPAGLIGLLNIDNKNKKAEYYICIADNKFKGKGVADIASELLVREAYEFLNLNKIYLFTELKNIRAQKLFERIGFVKEGLLKEDLIHDGHKVDRYVYGLYLKEYINKIEE